MLQSKDIRNITTLKNWDKNPRSIKDKDFNRLKKQIKKLGQYKPLLITNDGTVLGGNMRLRAYKEMGISDIWVSVVKADTEEERLEYALSDNDRAGFYDEDLLANIHGEYPEFDWEDYAVDMQAPTTLDDLFKEDDDIEEDEAPQLSNELAKSELGKVYQLGRHRLMCGDATKIEDVEKLMNGQKADMVFTDPPYGYSYESNHQDTHKELLNDDKILDFMPMAWEATKENAPFYVFCGWQTVDKWINTVKDNDLKLKNIIIWKKNNWSMGDLTGAYAGQYEMILFAHKGRIEIEGERDRDVWEFDREAPTDHPTIKPVNLVAHALRNHKADNVLDLFGGSGSTLIACEQTNRSCYMMELDPKYCDVIRKRYAKFIGKENQWEELSPEVTGK